MHHIHVLPFPSHASKPSTTLPLFSQPLTIISISLSYLMVTDLLGEIIVLFAENLIIY